MNPGISVEIREIDVRSSKFSCELTVENSADDEFEIVEITPRLPRGVILNEAVDAASVDSNRRHRDLAARASRLITLKAITKDRPTIDGELERFKIAIKEILTENLFDVYIKILMFQSQKGMEKAMRNLTRVEVVNFQEASVAIDALGIATGDDQATLNYYLRMLKELEDSGQFSRGSGVATILKGEQFKAIYILSSNRSPLNVTSYSISFDVILKDKSNRQVTRTASASMNVSPSALPLTIVAISTALVGAGLSLATQGELRGITPTLEAARENLMAFPISAFTALIVFNIVDFTSINSHVKGKISWRTATLVGFLCGFLNEKVLEAVKALVS